MLGFPKIRVIRVIRVIRDSEINTSLKISCKTESMADG